MRCKVKKKRVLSLDDIVFLDQQRKKNCPCWIYDSFGQWTGEMK